MATLLDFLLFLGVIALWTALLYFANRKWDLSRWNLVPVGPFLMVKTRRGRDFIDRSARFRRAWRVFGDLSIVLVGLTMVGITALLVWEAVLVRNIPPDRAPSPELLLGVPGLNPIIPVGYGVFALAVAVALHEFMHGILARVSKVKIESLGVLLCILPIGAFVEPSEPEMKALPRRERARIYSVGAGINILLAFLFGFLFSTMMLYGVEPLQPHGGGDGRVLPPVHGRRSLRGRPWRAPPLYLPSPDGVHPAPGTDDGVLPALRPVGVGPRARVLSPRERDVLALLAEPHAR